MAPVSTSTTDALIPLPPTSTPIATRPGARSCIGPASEVVDGDPTVDHEVGPVRPAALVGGEVDRDVNDLLGLAEAAARVAGKPDLLSLLVLDEPVHEERRLDRTGRDRVRAHALRRELDGQTPGEREDRA